MRGLRDAGAGVCAFPKKQPWSVVQPVVTSR
eukprot:gene12631-biopygen9112